MESPVKTSQNTLCSAALADPFKRPCVPCTRLHMQDVVRDQCEPTPAISLMVEDPWCDECDENEARSPASYFCGAVAQVYLFSINGWTARNQA